MRHNSSSDIHFQYIGEFNSSKASVASPINQMEKFHVLTRLQSIFNMLPNLMIYVFIRHPHAILKLGPIFNSNCFNIISKSLPHVQYLISNSGPTRRLGVDLWRRWWKWLAGSCKRAYSHSGFWPRGTKQLKRWKHARTHGMAVSSTGDAFEDG